MGATFFPQQQTIFRGFGIWFCIGTRLQESQPNQILRKHPDKTTVLYVDFNTNGHYIWVTNVLYVDFNTNGHYI